MAQSHKEPERQRLPLRAAGSGSQRRARSGSHALAQGASPVLGLIGFLVPKPKDVRLTARSPLKRCRRPARGGLNSACAAHGNQAKGRAVSRCGQAPRHALPACASRPAFPLPRAAPKSTESQPFREMAVAIPCSGIKGFFPLTDVCGKRENSVPTCKTGNCVSKFGLVRRARRITGCWAVIAWAPEVRTHWKQTGGLR
jgi:hypothetical protein